MKSNCINKENELRKIRRKQSDLEREISDIFLIVKGCQEKNSQSHSGFQAVSQRANQSSKYL